MVSSQSRCSSPSKPNSTSSLVSNQSINTTLSQRPTHKLSRSNSLSFSSSKLSSNQLPSSSSSPSLNPSGSRPTSPAKPSNNPHSSSPLIIHRSQSTSSKFKSNSVTARILNPPRTLSPSQQRPRPSSETKRSSIQFHPSSSSSDLSKLQEQAHPNEDEDPFVTPQKRRSSRIIENLKADDTTEELEAIQEASPLNTHTLESDPQNEPLDIKPQASKAENITVCVRVRPTTSSSLSDIDLDTPIPHRRQPSIADDGSKRFGSWYIHPVKSSISLSPCHPIIDRRGTGTSEGVHGSEGYDFTLDKIFDPYSTTDDLYRGKVQSIVQSCVKDGYNATVFAYGQTGSGKTFTMMGNTHEIDEELRGVIPRAVDEVFRVISADDEREYLLRVSYLEIYNEALKDLLSPESPSGSANRLTIHENNRGRVYVNGLREEVVSDPMQVLEALTRGEKSRHVGATDWNERSSRSHTVFTMTIESRAKCDRLRAEKNCTQISQLNLIDLAGSESAASSSERRKEGAFINKSLLALSNVISKLSKSDQHIPYRDSKLTRLLQTSLGGNAKVVVICAVSAGADSVVETLSTLRFARRAKMVVTQAERGTVLDEQSALIQAYQREITSLKYQLHQNSQALSDSFGTDSAPVLAELNAEKSKAESELTNLRMERIRLQEQIEHLNRRILTRNTIETNVRQAGSLNESRRIVSGQERGPSKKVRGRVTDLGGMMGLIGVGIRSAYLSSSLMGEATTPVRSPNSLDQFRRELRLEKDVKDLQKELEKLRLEKDQLSRGISSVTIEHASIQKEKPEDDVVQSSKSVIQPSGLNETGTASPEENQAALEADSGKPQAHAEIQKTCDQEAVLRNEIVELQGRLSALQVEYDGLKAVHCKSLSEPVVVPDQKEASEADNAQIVQLRAELSQALAKISALESDMEQKEVGFSKSEGQKDQLSQELIQAEDRIKHLESEYLKRQQEIETAEEAFNDQDQKFEAQIAELQTLLDEERKEKTEIEEELLNYKTNAQVQLDLTSRLVEELANLRSKSEKLEKKFISERSKTNEKELEVMNIMQERDQLAEKVNAFGLELQGLADAQDESAKVLISELQEALAKAEAESSELEQKNAEISDARQLSDSKLQETLEELSRSKSDSRTFEDSKKEAEMQSEKLKRMVQRLQEDLIQARLQEKALTEQAEKRNQERMISAEISLQMSYEAKLEQMKKEKSDMKTHIQALENRLTTLEKEPPTRQTAAESMETIVDLQSKIDEQDQIICALRSELVQARLASDSGRRPAPREFERGHQSMEYEVERLHHIIDEQEKRLSDAKTDLAKWQAHVRNQTEMITKLQSNPDFFKKPNSEFKPFGKLNELSSSSSFRGSSNSNPYRLSKPPSRNSASYSPGLGSSTSAASTLLMEGIPKPLPVPESFGVDEEDEWRRRKNRRRTIEKDMAKLKDENVVERKKNFLLSATPTQSPTKAKRVLSGISNRNSRLGRAPLPSESNNESIYSHPSHISESSRASSNYSSQGYYD